MTSLSVGDAPMLQMHDVTHQSDTEDHSAIAVLGAVTDQPSSWATLSSR